MRKDNVKKNFWINERQDNLLKKKCKKAGITESELVRRLVTDVIVKEKPDDRFYEVMKEMRAIGNNLNQIARKANSEKGFIDVNRYNIEAEKWNQFILKVKKEYLGIK